MSEYIIQTNNLTKQYGEQKSVSAMNLHVKKEEFMDCWDVMEQEKRLQ